MILVGIRQLVSTIAVIAVAGFVGGVVVMAQETASPEPIGQCATPMSGPRIQYSPPQL